MLFRKRLRSIRHVDQRIESLARVPLNTTINSKSYKVFNFEVRFIQLSMLLQRV